MVNYDIDLNTKYSDPIDTGIYLTQGDYGQIQFTLRVKNDGAYVTDAVSATINIRLENRIPVVGNLIKSGNGYVYRLLGNELSIPGKAIADVKFKYSDGRSSSCRFLYHVREDTINDSSIEAGGYVGKLDELEAAAEELVDKFTGYEDIYEKTVKAKDDAIAATQNTINATNAAKNAAERAEAKATGAETAAIKADEARLQSQVVTGNTQQLMEEIQRKLNAGELNGAQGISAVISPQTGMFCLAVDPETGDFYAVYPDGGTPPTFEYNSSSGELFLLVND
ncbi:hypothetical protein CE91St54_10470 [Hungatella hathewayi]|jgi:hypothetical protein|uniref:BppU N-terminal domain-containing protein n=1 Tax=Hungatella hathewayi TaxID=154046 RepID=A0AA37JCK3_9FIRM|nr:BppU family phage baseplate upper protein [Hungatella hathewayi]GKG99115.1 hypothetical protein CE91St55_10970 [Hungatella hathewayi]GKH05939.1 hypothetical protein CE91St54_10470 [Hungatella hathewayi]DAL76037.1 MAG TPA: tail protein [Caudoviricetes sp.]